MTRTLQRISLWLVLQLVAAGCTAVFPRAAPFETEPTVSSTDYELIELVVVDFMEFKDFRLGSENKSQIVLNEKTNGSGGFSDDQLNGEFGSAKEGGIPVQIGADLRRRNSEEPLSLSGFKPKNPKILVEELPDIAQRSESDFERKYPQANAYVEAWLPGYSKDRKTAVVRVRFGPSPHAGTATYMLENREGRWKVKWRTTTHSK